MMILGADCGDADSGGDLAVARVRGRRRRRRDRRAARWGWSSALRKIEAASQRVPLDANPATAHMFIIKPFSGGGIVRAVQHPSADRAARFRRCCS